MNTDIDLVDFMDLINYTLHKDFVEKWRYKYSEKFIKHFQIKILESLNKQKIIKLTKNCSFLMLPGTMHMRIAKLDTQIIEMSTKDRDDDSIIVHDGKKFKFIETRE